LLYPQQAVERIRLKEAAQ